MKSAFSSSKPRKKTKTSTSTNNEYKISELPDPILSQILSFSPTKSAVATSVLSKRSLNRALLTLWSDGTSQITPGTVKFLRQKSYQSSALEECWYEYHGWKFIPRFFCLAYVLNDRPHTLTFTKALHSKLLNSAVMLLGIMRRQQTPS